jgi:hypothetical protein
MELDQLALAEVQDRLGAQPMIQDQGGGLRDRVEEQLVEADDRREEGAGPQGIPREVGLRGDLSHDRDPEGLEEEGRRRRLLPAA